MAENVVDVVTDSPEDTFRLGERFAGTLIPGDVIAISGGLGSGKTVMVKGICSGLDVEDYVTSPTFTLIQEYCGKYKVYHFDFYRLQSLREIEELGLNEYFESDGVSLIEWADRAEPLLPLARISIRLHRILEEGHPAETRRRVQIADFRGSGTL